MVKFFNSIFGWTFKKIWKKLSFCCYFTEYWENYHFLNMRNIWKRFDHFWLRYHHLIFHSTCVNIRADSEYISAESALKPQFSLKQRWFFQFWTALIQRKSEMISSETELSSADVFQVPWISPEKVKSLKQLCSALIISGTSTRVTLLCQGLIPFVEGAEFFKISKVADFSRNQTKHWC